MREIGDAADVYQREVEQRDRLIIGVNEQESADELKIPLLQIDAEAEAHHIGRLERVRTERDGNRTQEALAQLREAAGTSENLMPYILDAVRAYATLGEMMQVLREEWGEYEASWF